MILLLMLIHLVLALAAFGGLRAGRLHFAPSLLPALFLLPLWGPMFVLVSEMHYLGGEKADEEPESRRFDITDEVYRSINMESGSVSELSDAGEAEHQSLTGGIRRPGAEVIKLRCRAEI